MYTLGIETSCDETSCAVLQGEGLILSNVVASSLPSHQPFGGVVPEIASRHCLEQIDVVFARAMEEAGIEPEQLELVAVTHGPGLIGSLLVGVSFAKAISYGLGIPLIGVNHLEAHLAANFIQDPGSKATDTSGPPDSFIGLVISGGHTLLTYHDRGSVEVLGRTVDDAVGEAYDKVAKMLGLGYPGGPVLDKLARTGNPKAFRFTRPKQNNRFDFSFSGIKTAVLYLIQDRQRQSRPIDESFKRDVAAGFQSAVVDWLAQKAVAALEFKDVSDLVIGGGVSANSRLRERLSSESDQLGFRTWFPPMSLTLDNAAMIAKRGKELFEQGFSSTMKLTADPHLKIG